MKNLSNEINHGLALAAASFLWICAEYLVGLHGRYIHLHPTLTNLFAVIPIVIMVRAARIRRALDGGTLSWKHGLASGMIISAITGLLGAPSMWLFLKVVNPNYFSAMIAEGLRRGCSQAEMDAAFNFKGYALAATFGPLVMGFVTALIVTAVLKRRRPLVLTEAV